MTLWADPKTALPIRIEVKITDPTISATRKVLSNFRYNVDLDPSLFSCEPPPGYQVQQQNPDFIEGAAPRNKMWSDSYDWSRITARAFFLLHLE